MRTKFLTSLLVSLAGLGLGALPLTPIQSLPSSGQVAANPAIASRLEVLSTGRHPKRSLRFTPPVNTRETLIMTVSTSMNLETGGQVLPTTALPGTQAVLSSEVKRVDPNGDIYAEVAYDSFNVLPQAGTSPQISQAIQSEYNKLKGLKGSLIMDSRGNTKKVNFTVPAQANANLKQILAQLNQSFDQLSSPFPAEAIGVGAKWRVTYNTNLLDIRLNTIAVYEVAAITNDQVALNITLDQNAPTQAINLPGVPTNSVNLVGLKSLGSGKTTISTKRILPLAASMAVNSKATMNAKNTRSGQNQTLTMTTATQAVMQSQ
jgi:hypothetical protein